MTHQEKHEAHVLDYLTRVHTMRDQRAAVRCGLGDAAHLCDAIAKDIEGAGRNSKARREAVAVAKRCGDAIWALYECIDVPQERSEP